MATWFDGFRRAVPAERPVGDGGTAAPGQTAGNEVLRRRLKARHLQMIAIGGSIGAGFFVGTGLALRNGGPASLVIDFSITGAMLLITVNALGELATLYPVAGSFYIYSVKFIDPAWGFAMGWNYALNWLVCLPFELTAASLTIKFWDSSVNITVWITVFFTLVIAANMFGVLGYGEVEFFLSTIKIVAIIGFIILGVIIDCGGVPTDDRGYIGGRYWQDPGAFANGFKGFCSVFVSASFAYGGIETVGLAAAESANPRRTIPKATKQVIWRILLFYVVSLSVLGLIVPSNAKVLLGATGAQTKASPFVLAINMAGIKVLPSIFNAVITVSVMSVGTSSTYASTRTIQALCSQGMGPKCLNYVDRTGRPLFALVIALAFGLLAYINAGSTGGGFFDWLLALGGLSNFFTWGSICLAHIRFRAAWDKSGRALDELPYQATFGIVGSWLGLALNILCLVAQFYIALSPVGRSPNARIFFQSYLQAPVVVVLYIFWKLYAGNWSWYVKIKDIDLHTGRRGTSGTGLIANEGAEKAVLPAYKRWWDFLC